MRGLRDELNASYVGPECTCGALSKFIQDQHFFQFLSGLNETYNTVRSNTLMMTSLPSISKVYGLLQQDESQKKTQSGILNLSSDSVSFHASPHTPSYKSRPYNQKVSFNSKNQNVPMTCKYCKNLGTLLRHAIDSMDS